MLAGPDAFLRQPGTLTILGEMLIDWTVSSALMHSYSLGTQWHS